MNLSRIVAVALFLAGIGCAARSSSPPVVPHPENSPSARLTVNLLGLESDRGVVAVALYDSAESFKDRSDPVAAGRIEPREGTATWTVEALEPGRYAVAAYHDLNANGRLDRSRLGPPSEPYGFSNNARGTFGSPKFDKAAIDIGPGALTIEIKLR
jgi:uncharacterized protein (DUF2141 family)